MNTGIRKLLWACGMLLLLPQLLFPFQVIQETPQDSSRVRKPEPIPVVRIIPEIQEINDEISLNAKKIEPGNLLKRIDSLYPGFKTLITSEAASAEAFISSNPNRQKIDNLTKRWNEYRAQLIAWETAINDYANRNFRLLERFQSEGVVWDLTLQKAEADQLPAELLGSIREVTGSLRQIGQQTVDNNNTYLRLETRINRLLERVDEVVESLYAKKGSETYKLFYHRHPPIWDTRFDTGSALENSDAPKDTLSGAFRNMSEMARTKLPLLLLLAVITGLLLAFVRYLRKRVLEAIPPEQHQDPSGPFFLVTHKRFMVVGFLLGVAAKLEFVAGPKIVDDAITLLLLVLGISLIWRRIPNRYRGLIAMAVAFLLLDALKTYVWFASAWYRVYMFAEALLLVGALYYFTYPIRKRLLEVTTPIGRFALRLLPAAYFLCLVSVVSNVLGYTNLSDLSLKVCTQCGVYAIIFYAILRVLEGLAVSWLEQRFARREKSDPAYLKLLSDRTRQAMRIGLAVLFVIFFLTLIDEMRDFQNFLGGLLSEPYKVGNLTFTLGSILMFLLILALSYVVSRLIAFFVSDDYGLLHFFRLPKGVASAISLVLRYSIIAFGLVLALSYLNVDLSRFNLMAGALGLGIGFGLQTVISNFVSGLILVFERPILPGDTIEVDNLLGKVEKIGIRASNISTYDGAEVVVPNVNLISNDLINWTMSNSTKRVEIKVGASYGADPNQILEILRGCAAQFDYVLKDPQPVALFSEFGDSSLIFILRFWVHFEMGLQSKSDVSVAIYNAFKARGIEIPFPQRDLHIKTLPPRPDPPSANPA